MNRVVADETVRDATSQRAPRRYSPMWQLVATRLREFLREPEAVFWVYGFPIVMVVALGIAFRNKPVEIITVDVVDNGAPATWAMDALGADERFKPKKNDEEAARQRLRTGKTDLVVSVRQPQSPTAESARHIDYVYDPTKPASELARNTADDLLQRAAGRKDVATAGDEMLEEPGGRYIDFL